MTSRRQIEERVDELAAEHEGAAFADAIRAYSEELGREERELLKDVVLERAASLDQALMERVDTRGWFKRQWDRASGLDSPR